MEKGGAVKRENIIYFLISFILVLLIIAIITSVSMSYSPPKLEDKTVMNVVDGDTFEYYDSALNKIVKVRLLCVDTPEKGEKGYEAAKEYLKSLILNKKVLLRASVNNTDEYGRLLRYVYIDESWGYSFINKLIVSKGYGELWVIPPETCKEMF